MSPGIGDANMTKYNHQVLQHQLNNTILNLDEDSPVKLLDESSGEKSIAFKNSDSSPLDPDALKGHVLREQDKLS